MRQSSRERSFAELNRDTICFESTLHWWSLGKLIGSYSSKSSFDIFWFALLNKTKILNHKIAFKLQTFEKQRNMVKQVAVPAKICVLSMKQALLIIDIEGRRINIFNDFPQKNIFEWLRNGWLLYRGQ